MQTVRGTVLAGPGQPEPVPPTVQILGADGRSLSSRTVADADGGFQLSFGAGALDGGAVLQVSPGPGALGAVAALPVSDLAQFGTPFVVGDDAPPVQLSGQVLGPVGVPDLAVEEPHHRLIGGLVECFEFVGHRWPFPTREGGTHYGTGDVPDRPACTALPQPIGGVSPWRACCSPA